MTSKAHTHTENLSFLPEANSRARIIFQFDALLQIIILNKSGELILFSKVFYSVLCRSDFFRLVDRIGPGAQSSRSF